MASSGFPRTLLWPVTTTIPLALAGSSAGEAAVAVLDGKPDPAARALTPPLGLQLSGQARRAAPRPRTDRSQGRSHCRQMRRGAARPAGGRAAGPGAAPGPQRPATGRLRARRPLAAPRARSAVSLPGERGRPLLPPIATGRRQRHWPRGGASAGALRLRRPRCTATGAPRALRSAGSSSGSGGRSFGSGGKGRLPAAHHPALRTDTPAAEPARHSAHRPLMPPPARTAAQQRLQRPSAARGAGTASCPGEITESAEQGDGSPRRRLLAAR